ncbi:hypothetical protein ALC56_03105 [Trachymyrmex septentrionalis]|uniref:Uncharacterized protein n=1 Tax=Trachymyrmex septentrionalis TaxID=34720 RepID=A0A151JZZ8_9HYME|nr:hypothetical protein ALC56_03105 [Trachymyrmex septentrionalis]
MQPLLYRRSVGFEVPSSGRECRCFRTGGGDGGEGRRRGWLSETPRNRNPYGARRPSFTPLPHLFLSHSGSEAPCPPLSFFRPSNPLLSDHPSSLRSVGKGGAGGRPSRGWPADSGTT